MIEHLPLKGHVKIDHYRGPDLIWTTEGKQTVTTVGKGWIVDLLQGTPAATQQVKHHQSGLGTTAAAAGNTNVETALYSRTTGTRTEGASANIYRSVATVNYTGSHTISEWGIFTSSATVAAGAVMIARKTFSRSVISGDSIQFTWDLTVG